MSAMDTEAARIAAAIEQRDKRVKRVQAGEVLPPYGFDAQGRDMGATHDDKD